MGKVENESPERRMLRKVADNYFRVIKSLQDQNNPGGNQGSAQTTLNQNISQSSLQQQ